MIILINIIMIELYFWKSPKSRRKCSRDGSDGCKWIIILMFENNNVLVLRDFRVILLLVLMLICIVFLCISKVPRVINNLVEESAMWTQQPRYRTDTESPTMTSHRVDGTFCFPTGLKYIVHWAYIIST